MAHKVENQDLHLLLNLLWYHACFEHVISQEHQAASSSADFLRANTWICAKPGILCNLCITGSEWAHTDEKKQTYRRVNEPRGFPLIFFPPSLHEFMHLFPCVLYRSLFHFTSTRRANELVNSDSPIGQCREAGLKRGETLNEVSRACKTTNTILLNAGVDSRRN